MKKVLRCCFLILCFCLFAGGVQAAGTEGDFTDLDGVGLGGVGLGGNISTENLQGGFGANPCLVCPMFRVIFYKLHQIILLLFDEFVPVLRLFVSIGMGLWILFFVLRYMGDFTNKGFQSFGQFFSQLSSAFFRLLVGIVLLSKGMGYLTSYVVMPIVDFSTSYGTEVMLIFYDKIDLDNLLEDARNDEIAASSQLVQKNGFEWHKNVPFGLEMSLSLMRYMYVLNDMMTKGIAQGQHLYVQSVKTVNGWIWDPIEGFYNFFKYLDVILTSALIIICFLALLAVAGLQFLRILLDYAVVLLFLPFFVAAWVFPYTRKNMTQKGFNLFVSANVRLIVISVAVAIGVSLIGDVLSTGLDADESFFNLEITAMDIADLRPIFSICYSWIGLYILGAFFVAKEIINLAPSIGSEISSDPFDQSDKLVESTAAFAWGAAKAPVTAVTGIVGKSHAKRLKPSGK